MVHRFLKCTSLVWVFFYKLLKQNFVIRMKERVFFTDHRPRRTYLCRCCWSVFNRRSFAVKWGFVNCFSSNYASRSAHRIRGKAFLLILRADLSNVIFQTSSWPSLFPLTVNEKHEKFVLPFFMGNNHRSAGQLPGGTNGCRLMGKVRRRLGIYKALKSAAGDLSWQWLWTSHDLNTLQELRSENFKVVCRVLLCAFPFFTKQK